MKIITLSKLERVLNTIKNKYILKSDLENNLNIAFLSNSTGNLGDCTVIYNNNFCMIIDFGWENDCSTLINYLDSKNITKIDYIIISHFHDDHIGHSGARGFSVFKDHGYNLSNCTVFLPHKDIDWTKVQGSDLISKSQYNIKTWLGRIDGCQIIEPTSTSTYDVIINKNLTLKLFNINPANYNTYYNVKEDGYGNTHDLCMYNNFSMGVIVEHYGNRIIFTGDIEPMAETLNYSFMQSADIYKVEHHGLNAICDFNYVNTINPQNIVICNNSGEFLEDMGAPSVLKWRKGGARFFNTKHGLVEFTSKYVGVTTSSILVHKISEQDAPISTDYDLYYGKLIHDVDLNNLKMPGIYSCRNDSLSSTITNKPLKDSGIEYSAGFKLVVEKLTYSNAIIQTLSFVGDLSHKRFYRYYIDDTWSDWKSINPSKCIKHVFTADDFLNGSAEVSDNSFVYFINRVMSMSMQVKITTEVKAYTDFIKLPAELANITPSNVQIPAFTSDGKIFILYLQYASGIIRSRVAIPANTTLYFNFCTTCIQDKNI